MHFDAKPEIVVHDLPRDLRPVAVPEGCLGRVDSLSAHLAASSYWVRERNANPERIRANCRVSKKGEFIALEHMVAVHGFPRVEIDTEIRHGPRKGWVPDLGFRGADPAYPDVHVKTCDDYSRQRVGDLSWTFQLKNASGSGGRDPLFDHTGNDHVCLTYVRDEDRMRGAVLAVLPWSAVRPLLDHPRAWSLRGIKLCLYYQRLLENRDRLLTAAPDAVDTAWTTRNGGGTSA